jgi:hypothetical protein
MQPSPGIYAINLVSWLVQILENCGLLSTEQIKQSQFLGADTAIYDNILSAPDIVDLFFATIATTDDYSLTDIVGLRNAMSAEELSFFCFFLGILDNGNRSRSFAEND